MHPSTPRQLVEAGIFQNVAKARKRLNAGQKHGMRVVGSVNLFGHDEKLWAMAPVNKPQHSGEETELCVRFLKLPNVRAIRRGALVDEHLADFEIDFENFTAYGELDRGTVGYAELLTRLRGYADCGDVLWSVPSQTRINGIIGYARRHGFSLPPSMWFGIYRNLLENITGPWINAEGQEITL